MLARTDKTNPSTYGLVPLESLSHQIDRMFQDFFGDAVESRIGRINPAVLAPMDIWEDDEAYYLETDVPGFNMDQIELLLEGRELTLRGSMEEVREDTRENIRYHRKERRARSFERSLLLPEDVDTEDVTADLTDGVLKVRLGKTEAGKPKKIEIRHTVKQQKKG